MAAFRAVSRLILFTVVAFLQLRAATAAVVSEDVPLPGGTAALARALAIDPVPDRGRFLYEIIRLLYNAPEGRRPPADAFLLALHPPNGKAPRRPSPMPDTRSAELVPVPLTTDFWSSAVFHRKVAARELVTTI